MLLSGVLFVEVVFLVPGLGRILLEAVNHQDATFIGATAATLILLALLSRFLGNLLLAAVDEEPPARTGDFKGTEKTVTLAIGGGVTVGLLVLLFLLAFAAPEDPLAVGITDRMEGPSGAHLFGSDQLGRDVFSLVLHGGRIAAQIGLPMGLLAFIFGFPMVIARVGLNRAGPPAVLYGVQGVLEGLVAAPWLVIGVLIQANVGPGWPFLALAVILVPRALRMGWTLGAGENLQVAHLTPLALRLGVLFIAAAVVMSAALGFIGVAFSQPQPELGLMLRMLSGSQRIIEQAPWVVIFPGLFLSLVVVIWLVVAALLARSGTQYRAVGWASTMS